MTAMSGRLDQMCAQLEQSNRGEQQRPAQQLPWAERVGRYEKPEHMPVLFSRAVLAEMEQRWPKGFAQTRRNRLQRLMCRSLVNPLVSGRCGALVSEGTLEFSRSALHTAGATSPVESTSRDLPSD